jgi:hypothetical protein
MKKKLVAVCFSFIFINTVLAQYTINSPTRFAVSGGLDISNYAENYLKEGSSPFQSKLGFRVALELEYHLGSNLYFVPELAFTQRGAKQKLSTGGTYSESTNWLSLPVNIMYKFDLDDDSGIRFCLFAGPYMNYAFSAKQKLGELEEKIELGYDFNKYKTIDYGLNIGAGLEFGDYFIRSQYDYGMTNLLNGKAVDYQKNRNIGISFGYLF